MKAGYSIGANRLEDVFEDEVNSAFASIDSFKTFARSNRGLCLDESDIHQITEDCYSIDEQKVRILQRWKEKNGAGVTASKIRSVLERCLHPDSEKGGGRLEDIFLDEVIPTFASINSFKRFARSKRGLCLDESDIHQITEDSYSVEEQKLGMLRRWKEKTGAGVTASTIRSVLERYLHPDSEKGYISLSEQFGLYKDRKLSKYSHVYMGEYRSIAADPVEVVVKLIDFDEKKRREINSLQELGAHSNVVTMLHHGLYKSDLQEFIYIVMESCRRENLWDYLTKMKELGASLNGSQKKAVIKQFLEGLQFIHSNEIIHRDLKPQNLLISKNGRFIKITDFGISRQLRPGHSNTVQSISNFATDGFRAPEAYLNDVISKKADVYSAGLISYTVVSDGSHAFGDDPQKWISNIKDNENRNLSLIYIEEEEPMRNLLDHMLQPNPKERPTIEDVLRDNIFRHSTTELALYHIHHLSRLMLEKKNQLSGDAVGGNMTKKYINRQPHGKMTSQLTHDKLLGCEHILYGTVTVNFSFPPGMLEGISYPAQEFTAYLPGGYQGMVTSWDFAHELLTQAFNAGLAFKLEVVEEEQKGKIVPDIPLKTNKSGGVKNNGYPDGSYLKNIYEVLKSKGFVNEQLDRRLEKGLL